MKEAKFYQKLDKLEVKCDLCHHGCVIKNKQAGICGVRKNDSGVLYTLNYGHPVAMEIDPIEKKPLFHFYPGSQALSIGTLGCNLSCSNCQNWNISQSKQIAQKIQEFDEVNEEKIGSMGLFEKKAYTLMATINNELDLLQQSIDEANENGGAEQELIDAFDRTQKTGHDLEIVTTSILVTRFRGLIEKMGDHFDFRRGYKVVLVTEPDEPRLLKDTLDGNYFMFIPGGTQVLFRNTQDLEDETVIDMMFSIFEQLNEDDAIWQ